MTKNKIPFNLSFKFIIAISLIIILTSVVLSLFFINAQSILMKDFIERKAETLARTLATSSEYSVLSLSREVLSHLTRNTINQEDVLYSVIYDKNCVVLSETETENPKVIAYVQSTPIEPAIVADLEHNRYHKELYSISSVGEVIDVLVPIISRDSLALPNTLIYKKNIPSEEMLIGVVRVGLSLERVNYQIKKMTHTILLITALVILAGIVISSFFVQILVNPIQALTLGTKKIAAGNFDYRVPITTSDEFAVLATSFNSMAMDMATHIREINREKRELLELKVALEQRTLELEETLDKVKEIQDDLIRSEKFATIGRLASNVAHELRNPLSAIKNISYFLSRMGAFSDDKSKQMVNMLSSEVLRANKIITDLLDYSKTKKLNKQEVPIETFIEKAIVSVPMPQQIELIKQIEPMTVFVDPDKMTQIIINLLSNAKDAMPADGGEITITTGKTAKNFYIKVEDTACGMDDETVSRLFEPLFTTKLKGIGLGLSIVKEIIEAHSGTISVKSKKGVGTTFTIEIPLA